MQCTSICVRAEVKGTFVLQPDGTLSWKEHLKSGKWNLLPGVVTQKPHVTDSSASSQVAS